MNAYTNRISRLRSQKFKFLNHLDFLLRCKRHKICPKFLHLNVNLSLTRNIFKALQRTKISILRAHIKDVRFRLSQMENELYKLHINLGNNHPQFSFIESRSWHCVLQESLKHKIKLGMKFNELHKKHRERITDKVLPRFNKNAAVNLSDLYLDNNEAKILKLDSNFSVSKPPSFPHLIAPIEQSFRNSRLSSLQKESFRHLL